MHLNSELIKSLKWIVIEKRSKWQADPFFDAILLKNLFILEIFLPKFFIDEMSQIFDEIFCAKT